jgi:hypothetical protein
VRIFYHTLTKSFGLPITLQLLLYQGLMMSQWMMLGEVIGLIGCTWFPVDNDLELFDTLADPLEQHVIGFGAALFGSVNRDAFGSFVVFLDGSGRLWMTQFIRHDA